MAERAAGGPGSPVKRGIPERGDIWSIDLNPASGHEQRGKRPILVLTPLEFNRLGLVLACPISQGAQFARTQGFAVSLAGSGTRTQGVILCHQSRTVDYKARRARFVETVPDYVVMEVLARVTALLE
jgi:Growth inhibitor